MTEDQKTDYSEMLIMALAAKQSGFPRVEIDPTHLLEILRNTFSMYEVIKAFDELDAYLDLANEAPVCPACAPEDARDLMGAHGHFAEVLKGYRLERSVQQETA